MSGGGDVEAWKAQVDALKRERDRLVSERAAADQRATAMEVVIQECEAALAHTRVAGGGEAMLLTRWREKVFALMVQNQAATLASKETSMCNISDTSDT